MAPRCILHGWAFIGEGRGRLPIVFAPADKIEAYFRAVTEADSLPPRDPKLWKAHGVDVVGPLTVD